MLGPTIKTHWWSREDLLFIFLVALLLYLPGLGPWREVFGNSFSGSYIPLLDRDEPRFASAARGMLETSDYIVPRFNGDLRPDKPPFVYWAITISYRLVGVNELGARLPSAFFSTLTLFVIYLAAGRRFGRLTGIVAALMLATCVLFVAESRFATADATMLFFTSVCMAMAWNAWEAGNPPSGGVLPKLQHVADHQLPLAEAELDYRARRLPFWQALLFWIALAGGTLTKGVPLAFVFVPMVILSIASGQLGGAFVQWKKQSIARRIIHLPSLAWHAFLGANWTWWRQLRPLLGFPLLIALVGSWFVAAGVATNWELPNQMIGTHLIVRVFGEQLGAHILALLHIQVPQMAAAASDPMKTYRQPPGFYLGLVWATFWPWTPLLIPGAYYLVRRARGKTVLAIDRRPYQFILAWIVPMWIILELSSGKLVHYVLPLYLAMIILCADMLVASWHRLTDVMSAAWLAYARWFWMLVWFTLGFIVLLVPKHFVHNEDIVQLSLLFAGTLFAAGLATAMAWGRPSWPYITALTWAVALMIANTTFAPNLDELGMSQRIMQRAAGLESRGYAFAAMGYEEPTLVFYASHAVPMRSQFTAADWQKKLDAFFAPGPKRLADPSEIVHPFGLPGTAMALIIDQPTLEQFKNEGKQDGRDFYVLVPTFNFFHRADGRPETKVIIITNLPPVAATEPATSETSMQTQPATAK